MAAGSAKLQTPGSEAGGSAADTTGLNWNSKKVREEYESFRSKLVDQRFDPKHFPDPLLPRSTADPRNNPRTTPEVERRIDQIIAEYESSRVGEPRT
ncbi:hypothetical protein CCHL11_01975 [Colletotrichum chlorophyti]|uniref:Uncharacterized protein n=1 Tax=Colletotrichum chlorophyti TaxID=708187 RepID=A0A1Q8RVQ6_9PEZI|nr:hypothetical protein CCHL11_01975 [Colletotrichum chlorophyti]